MKPHQTSNANFIRSLFAGAMSFDVTRQDDAAEDDHHEEYNHSGINSVFDFSVVNHYYDMKLPTELKDVTEIPELTMMAWVRPTKEQDVRIFDSYVANNGDDDFGGFGFGLYLQNKKVRFLGIPKGGVQSSVSNINIGEWNHCCVTFKKGELRFYINGILDTTVDQGSARIYLNPPFENKLCIGYSESIRLGGYYEGYMSQLSIWNVALSEYQVETCSKHNLLLLKGSTTKDLSSPTNSQYFVDSELYQLFKNHALIYLPYLQWKNDNGNMVKNFGMTSSDTLDITIHCSNGFYDRKNLSTSYFQAQYLPPKSIPTTTAVLNNNNSSSSSAISSSEIKTSQMIFPVFNEVYWIQELHHYFSKEKKDLIVLLLLISHRHSPFIGELSGEVLDLIFSYLD